MHSRWRWRACSVGTSGPRRRTVAATWSARTGAPGRAGNDELSLIKEDDRSFTSFGAQPRMLSLVRSLGGRDDLVGVPIDVSKLRVIALCVPRRTC
jgi:hypothetical protein